MKVIGKINLDNTTTLDEVTIQKNFKGERMHRFSVPKCIRIDHALTLQQELGYHPAGYGFYSFNSSPTETSWKCADCCD